VGAGLLPQVSGCLRLKQQKQREQQMIRTQTNMLLGGGLLAASQAMAGDLLLWQTNSLSYLYGKDFAVNPSIQQTITFEHADRWKYGDNFLFLDSTYYNGEKDRNKGVHAYYGEFSPRLSFGKILDRHFGFGPIKDVLLAMTTLNFYYRQTEGSRPGDDVWQITPAWSYTLPLGNSNLLIDGYIDWVVDNDQNAHGTYHANLHFNPQIKYDLGKALGWREKQVYVGVEYSYWKDKYGIENSARLDTNENTTSLLVKVHF
jgi:nucleoside-specific outer membrane channel protein Tsx